MKNMACYLGHPIMDGQEVCSFQHKITISIACGAQGCEARTEEAGDISTAMELLKLHREVCPANQVIRQPVAKRAAKRLDVMPPKFLEREAREDFVRKSTEFHMYKERAEITKEEAAADLYQSCETPLKKKLMASSKIKENPGDTDFGVILEEIERIATAKLNITVERHEFRSLEQEENEMVADFEARLNAKARFCNFMNCDCCSGKCGSDRKEEELKTQILCGMRDTELQRTFLEKSEEYKSLSSITSAMRAKEAAVNQQSTLSSGNVSRVGERSNGRRKLFGAQRNTDQRSEARGESGRESGRDKCRKDRGSSKCKKCGRNPDQLPTPWKCPAFGKQCLSCGKPNHFSAVCRGNQAKEVEEEQEEETVQIFGLEIKARAYTRTTASCNSLVWDNTKNMFLERPIMQKKPLHLKVTTVHHSSLRTRGYVAPPCPLLETRSYTDTNNCPDTGADILLAGIGAMQRLGITKENLHQNSLKVRAANSGRLNVWGFIPVELQVGSRTTKEVLYFAEGVKHMLVSRRALQELGCISDSFPYPEPMVEEGDPKSRLATSTYTGKLVRECICAAESEYGMSGLTPPQGVGHHSHCAGGIDPSCADGLQRISPEYGDEDSPSEAASGCAALRGGSRKKRMPAPSRPKKIPFAPTEENILNLENWLKEVFSDSAFNTSAVPLTKMTGPAMTIHLDPATKPIACHKPAAVAHHWREEVKRGLDEDEKLGVIEKVPIGVPTRWQSRMIVVAKKSGKPRRTVDLSPLNRYCLRETHPTEPTFHQLSRVPPGCWKTVLDAWNGYHAVELDEASREYTTFITEWGRYRYCRAPQGFLAAGDAYTRRMDEIVKNVSKKCKVIDDTMLFEETIEATFWKTFDYLKLCADNGITFNREKFEFCKKDVDFAGFTVTEDGIKPNKKMLDEISSFPEPTNITEARSWFGLIEQVAWSYTIKDTMSNFRDLLKPSGHRSWNWTEDLRREFQEAKKEIVRRVEEGVKTFNPDKKTCLATDWSKEAIGFLLLQKYCDCGMEKAPVCCKEGWRLIFAGSKKCSPAEARYAPIEGEALAVAWSLEKARLFTLGCPDLLVTTDHQPLVCILGDKALEEIPNPRLLRLKEKTLRFQFNIQYCPGKWNRGADAFSRAKVKVGRIMASHHNIDDDWDDGELEELGAAVAACDISDPEATVNMVSEEVSVTIEELAREGHKDKEFLAVEKAVMEGFPDTEEECGEVLKKFYKDRHQLTIVSEDSHEVLVFSDSNHQQRLFIPKALRNRIKQILHSGHRRDLSRVKMKADKHVYWPGMAGDLKMFINQCEFCQVNMPSHPKEKMIATKSPDFPFQMVAADFFMVEGHSYLVYVDRYSGWMKIAYFPRKEATSAELIKVLRTYFMDFGAPEELSSDRGSNLVSGEMKSWLKSWGVEQRLSSSRFAQSNGRAETAVKQAKKMVHENTNNGKLDSDKFARAMLAYHNSSIYPEIGERTIAQTLLGRNLRDAMPALKSFYDLSKKFVLERKEREKCIGPKIQKMVEVYNKAARDLPKLEVGDKVRVQNQTTVRCNKWDQTGTVVEVLKNRQYTVKISGSGRCTIRNRRHLRKIPADEDSPSEAASGCAALRGGSKLGNITKTKLNDDRRLVDPEGDDKDDGGLVEEGDQPSSHEDHTQEACPHAQPKMGAQPGNNDVPINDVNDDKTNNSLPRDGSSPGTVQRDGPGAGDGERQSTGAGSRTSTRQRKTVTPYQYGWWKK